MEYAKPLLTEYLEFQWPGEIFSISFFGISDCQCFIAWKKIDIKSIESFSGTEKVMIQTLIDETKPVVMGDKWRWLGISKEINNSKFFWNFRVIRILIQRTNSTVSNSMLLYKGYISPWFLDRWTRTCCGWELDVWISTHIKIKSTSYCIWTVTNMLHGSNQKARCLNRPPQKQCFRWGPWLVKSYE